jgi:hypothetical protein
MEKNSKRPSERRSNRDTRNSKYQCELSGHRLYKEIILRGNPTEYLDDRTGLITDTTSIYFW